ncbi:hypothetical protein AVEN_98274-1 [Araneus ventricosus]|uniref:Uncharacterized protein n=1 Tax=Araneus ventricosus TaxID=182803 RepID=A0A4Y2ICW2_ARAVE|nr:hypothetical protein AVEN_98274-1 [Araneus ventricosus]
MLEQQKAAQRLREIWCAEKDPGINAERCTLYSPCGACRSFQRLNTHPTALESDSPMLAFSGIAVQVASRSTPSTAWRMYLGLSDVV